MGEAHEAAVQDASEKGAGYVEMHIFCHFPLVVPQSYIWLSETVLATKNELNTRLKRHRNDVNTAVERD